MTNTNTFREHLQRAILDTCDLWDIWSEWWGYMTWPKKRQRQVQRQTQWQRQIHFESTWKERPQRLVTFEIFDQSDEETWPDQKKDNDKYKDKHNDKDKHNIKDKYISRAHSKSDPRDLWALRHLIRVMRGHGLAKKDKDKDNDTDNDKDNPRDLWHLRHWLQFRQLRTWIHDNLCCVTIKSDTGQHSQFLRCLFCHRLSVLIKLS